MEKEAFCREIVQCLIKYCNLDAKVAELMVSDSRNCILDSDEDFDLLSHETPYYWAMWLKYSNTFPEWHKDPSLWPPPKEYLDRLYRTE
jgi:hypothetical protein